MKRSEMIKVIKDYLDIVDEEPNMNLSNQDKAEYILGCCETWGMLPPAHIPKDKNSIWDSECEWEPEDD